MKEECGVCRLYDPLPLEKQVGKYGTGICKLPKLDSKKRPTHVNNWCEGFKPKEGKAVPQEGYTEGERSRSEVMKEHLDEARENAAPPPIHQEGELIRRDLDNLPPDDRATLARYLKEKEQANASTLPNRLRLACERRAKARILLDIVDAQNTSGLDLVARVELEIKAANAKAEFIRATREVDALVKEMVDSED